MKKLLFLFLLFFITQTERAQIASYTFQVNQTCTSCCSASACVSVTFNCMQTPLSGFALVTPTTTTPSYTLNPCFYNLCNGTYTMMVNGFSNSDPCFICNIDLLYPQQTTSTFEDLSNANHVVEIYPNPTQDEVTINIGNSTEIKRGTQMSIINTIGQKIISFRIESKITTYSLSELKPGIYFIELSENGNMIHKEKLILSK